MTDNIKIYLYLIIAVLAVFLPLVGAQAQGYPFLFSEQMPAPRPVEDFVLLELRADKSKPVADTYIVYTFSYQNFGSQPAINASLKAILPSDERFVSSAPKFTSKIDNRLSFDLADIQPGHSGTITVKAKISAFADAGDILLTSGVLNYKDSEGDRHSVNAYFASAVFKKASAMASLADVAGSLASNWFFDFLLGILLGYGIYRFFIKSKETDLAS